MIEAVMKVKPFRRFPVSPFQGAKDCVSFLRRMPPNLRAQGCWEYVQSKSNWADDISRLGIHDPWRKSHGFSLAMPLLLFPLPFIGLILVFEYL